MGLLCDLMMPRHFSKEIIETTSTEVAKSLGYQSLRQKQLDVIVGIVNGCNVFAVLPTGYGKSLCYAILPKLFDILNKPSHPSIVCVVTPLTAIITDQVCIFLHKSSSTSTHHSGSKLHFKRTVNFGSDKQDRTLRLNQGPGIPVAHFHTRSDLFSAMVSNFPKRRVHNQAQSISYR